MIVVDGDLLDELKLGKDAALKRLFDTFYVPLCIYSVQITDSLDISEDIVQDFFIRFWEKKKFEAVSGNLSHYLFNAIRNASLDFVKKNRPYALDELEEEAYSPIDQIYDEEELRIRREKLHRSLAQLSPQEYKILIAIVIENKKYKEVAREMNISVNTVKTYLSRALKHLRAQRLWIGLFFI